MCNVRPLEHSAQRKLTIYSFFHLRVAQVRNKYSTVNTTLASEIPAGTGAASHGIGLIQLAKKYPFTVGIVIACVKTGLCDYLVQVYMQVYVLS